MTLLNLMADEVHQSAVLCGTVMTNKLGGDGDMNILKAERERESAR